MGGGVQDRGTQIYLRPIHVDVWQKPSRYYKVIILQLKQINSFKKKKNPATKLTSLRPIVRKGNEKKRYFLKKRKKREKNFKLFDSAGSGSSIQPSNLFSKWEGKSLWLE